MAEITKIDIIKPEDLRFNLELTGKELRALHVAMGRVCGQHSLFATIDNAVVKHNLIRVKSGIDPQ